MRILSLNISKKWYRNRLEAYQSIIARHFVRTCSNWGGSAVTAQKLGPSLGGRFSILRVIAHELALELGGSTSGNWRNGGEPFARWSIAHVPCGTIVRRCSRAANGEEAEEPRWTSGVAFISLINNAQARAHARTLVLEFQQTFSVRSSSWTYSISRAIHPNFRSIFPFPLFCILFWLSI